MPVTSVTVPLRPRSRSTTTQQAAACTGASDSDKDNLVPAPPPLSSSLGDRKTFLKKALCFKDVGLTLQPSASSKDVFMVLEQKNGGRKTSKVTDVQVSNAERGEFRISTPEGKHTLRASSKAQMEQWVSYVPEVRAACARNEEVSFSKKEGAMKAQAAATPSPPQNVFRFAAAPLSTEALALAWKAEAGAAPARARRSSSCMLQVGSTPSFDARDRVLSEAAQPG